MFKLFKYFKWYYWFICLAIIAFVYIQVQLDLSLPEYMNEVIVTIGKSGEKGKIYNIGLIMIGVAILSVICSIIVGYLSSIVASGFSRIIRGKVYQKVQSFSNEEINQFSTSSLITRSTNDIQQVQMAVTMSLRMAITAPIMATLAVIKVWNVSTKISGIVAIGVLGIISLISCIFIYVIPKFKKIQLKVDELNLVTRENLTGIRVVRAYNAEDYQTEKFEKVNEDLTRTNLHVNRAMSLMDPSMQLALNGTVLAIFWFGAYLINANQLGSTYMEGLGNLMAFSTYGSQIGMSFTMLTFLFIMIPRASISGRRINEILNVENKIQDPINPKQPLEKGTIEFIDVSFKYPQAEGYVLSKINFNVKHGQTVAFIGPTGSGKSTIINLIPRLYEVTEGKILVDGVNVKDYNQKDLHSLIGYVPQKGTLFSGTIESNIRLGKTDATDEEINESLRVAQAQEFVFNLDDGIKHPISQGGKNVSGGQKQRLCIARAIIKNPEIYIFDDSFSALDYKTDRTLRQELNKRTKDATKIIVASRIGTILHADKIYVLENGKISAEGTHKELLKSSEIYRDMATSQLTKEELEYE